MRLLDDKGNSMECLNINPEKVKVLSEERIRILNMISEEAAYPAEMARQLKMPLQTIYYHIRILESAGLLEFVEYEERNGGIAKLFKSKVDSVSIILNNRGWRKTTSASRPVPKIIRPFVKNGFFNGLMVVGSPDPHGKYRARASELGSLELAMYLGQYAVFDFPLYHLDVRLGADDRKKNLIVAGGPKVNTVVHDINNKLPIRFDEKNFTVHSKITGKNYEENVGVIELVKNPYNPSARILLLGGLNHHGTKAAVIALVKRTLELGGDESERAKVVQGFDENGDGVVDSVEILE
jgi:DNA-binding transcriptional ArsR family regulator